MGKSKKVCPLTARVTEDELDQIKEKANRKNLSVSRYIVEKALQSDTASSAVMREAYRHICTIRDISSNWQFSDHEAVSNQINRECDELCHILKS